jgi:hypothetical protein
LPTTITATTLTPTANQLHKSPISLLGGSEDDKDHNADKGTAEIGKGREFFGAVVNGRAGGVVDDAVENGHQDQDTEGDAEDQ